MSSPIVDVNFSDYGINDLVLRDDEHDTVREWVHSGNLTEEELLDFAELLLEEYLDESQPYGEGGYWHSSVQYYRGGPALFTMDMVIRTMASSMGFENEVDLAYHAGMSDSEVQTIFAQEFPDEDYSRIEDMKLPEYLEFIGVEDLARDPNDHWRNYNVFNSAGYSYYSDEGKLILKKTLEHFIDSGAFYGDIEGGVPIKGFENITADQIMENYFSSAGQGGRLDEILSDPAVFTYLTYSSGSNYYYSKLYAENSGAAMRDVLNDDEMSVFDQTEYLDDYTLIEISTMYHQMYMWQKKYEFGEKSKELEDIYAEMQEWGDLSTQLAAFQKNDDGNWKIREYYEGGSYIENNYDLYKFPDGGVVYTTESEEWTAFFGVVCHAYGFDSWAEAGEFFDNASYGDWSDFADHYNDYRGSNYDGDEMRDFVKDRYSFPSWEIHNFFAYCRTEEGEAEFNFDDNYNHDNDYTYGSEEIDAMITAVNNKYASIENETNIITIDLNEILTRYNESIQYLSTFLDKIFQTIDGITNRI